MLIALCSVLLHDSPPDYLVLDFTSALENREHPRVAPEALHVELHRVSVAAMHLHRLARHPLGHLGGECLGESGLVVASLAGVLLGGREIAELARSFDLDRHMRELVANNLEVADRLAELCALPGVP